jgi:hypothetical protein
MSEDTREREAETFLDDDDDDEGVQASEYLLFHTDDEVCRISIASVVEIIEMQRITDVPDMPPFATEVINLRGRVIPIINIRLRFGMEERDQDDRTCITIVKAEGPPRGASWTRWRRGAGMGSAEPERHLERALERAIFVWTQDTHEVGDAHLGDAQKLVAVDGAVVLQAFGRSDLDLRRQGIESRIHGRAEHRREPGIDEDLAAHDDEHTGSSRISPRFTGQTSAW